MASEHTVADNIVYDLISIQYHALKGAEVYDRYLDDAHSAEHDDVNASKTTNVVYFEPMSCSER